MVTHLDACPQGWGRGAIPGSAQLRPLLPAGYSISSFLQMLHPECKELPEPNLLPGQLSHGAVGVKEGRVQWISMAFESVSPAAGPEGYLDRAASLPPVSGPHWVGAGMWDPPSATTGATDPGLPRASISPSTVSPPACSWDLDIHTLTWVACSPILAQRIVKFALLPSYGRLVQPPSGRGPGVGGSSLLS